MTGSNLSYRRRVLVASACPGTRGWANVALSTLGVDCEEVESGWEALARLLQGEPYDLVIADARLPGVNGVQVLTLLRSEGRGTPVLLLAPFCRESVRSLARRCGAAIVLEDLLDGTALRDSSRLLLGLGQRSEDRPHLGLAGNA